MRNFADELVLPFLWAQDGFSEPSEEMAKAIKFGLDAPSKLSLLGNKQRDFFHFYLLLSFRRCCSDSYWRRSCAWSSHLDAGDKKKC